VSEQFKNKQAESSGEETDEIVWKGQTKVFVMKKVTVGGESKLVREEDDEEGGGGGGEKKEEKEEKEEGKAGEVVDKWSDRLHTNMPACFPACLSHVSTHSLCLYVHSVIISVRVGLTWAPATCTSTAT